MPDDIFSSYTPRDETMNTDLAYSIGDRNTQNSSSFDYASIMGSSLGSLKTSNNSTAPYGSMYSKDYSFDPSIQMGDLSKQAGNYADYLRNKEYAPEKSQMDIALGTYDQVNSGVSAGSSSGPWGMLASGASSLISGLIANDQYKKQMEKDRESKRLDKENIAKLETFKQRMMSDTNNNNMSDTNYAPTFAEGGFSKSKSNYGGLIKFKGPKHKEEWERGQSGIPLGDKAEVQGGEVMGTMGDVKGYIFPTTAGFAKKALEVEDKYSLRPEDNVEMNTKNIYWKAIMAKNEARKLKLGIDSEGNPIGQGQEQMQGVNPMEQQMQPSEEEMMAMQQQQMGMGAMPMGQQQFAQGGRPDSPPYGTKEQSQYPADQTMMMMKQLIDEGYSPQQAMRIAQGRKQYQEDVPEQSENYQEVSSGNIQDKFAQMNRLVGMNYPAGKAQDAVFEGKYETELPGRMAPSMAGKMQSIQAGAIDNNVNVDMQKREEPKEVQKDFSTSKTFAEAFRTARRELGAGQIFTYKGKKYSTAYASEVGKKNTASPTSTTKDMMDVNQYAQGGRVKFTGGGDPSYLNQLSDKKIHDAYMDGRLSRKDYILLGQAYGRSNPNRGAYFTAMKKPKELIEPESTDWNNVYSYWGLSGQGVGSDSGSSALSGQIPLSGRTPQVSRVNTGGGSGNNVVAQTQSPYVNPNPTGMITPGNEWDYMNGMDNATAQPHDNANPNYKYSPVNAINDLRMGKPVTDYSWMPNNTKKNNPDKPEGAGDGQKGSNSNFMSQYGYMIPGMLAGSVGDIYDIYRGSKGGDPVNYERVMPSYLNMEQARVAAMRNADAGMEANRMALRNSGLSKGQMIGATLGSNAMNRGNLANTIGDLYMKQGMHNTGIFNQTQGMNAQIAMRESIARQQEEDAARSSISHGLHGLGSKAMGASSDIINTWNQGRIMEKYLKTQDFGFDKNGNKLIRYLDPDTNQYKVVTEDELDKLKVEWEKKKKSTSPNAPIKNEGE